MENYVNNAAQGELIRMLDDIDTYGDNLSDWEIEFLENMLIRTEAGGRLSDIQANKIKEIHENRVEGAGNEP